MLNKVYENKKNRKEYLFRNVGTVLFFCVLFGGMILGMILPLRPTVSDQEKRELTKFPNIREVSFLNGEYFKQMDTWSADTYPFRDELLAGNQALKSLYGLHTEQIHGNVTGGDEIPDIMEDGNGMDSSSSGFGSADGSNDTGNGNPDGGDEQAGISETEDAENDNQESESSEPESEGETVSSDVTESIGEDEIPNAGGVVADELKPQVQGSVYQDGSKAYGLYYFSRNAADIYINAVADMAKELDGVAEVYDMLIPDSSNIQLSDDKIQELAISDARKATDYYYKSMNNNSGNRIKTVPIYDTLLEHKDEYIYFNTDHHWTALGAYYAYTDWAAVKGVSAHSLDQFEKMEFPGFLGSYYSTFQSEELRNHPDTIEAYVPMGTNTMEFTQNDGQTLKWYIINDVSSYQAGVKYSCFIGGDNPISKIENPEITDGSSCVVVKESFANALIPFLVDHYQTIYIIDYRYYNDSVSSFVRENGVKDVIFINNLDAISDVETMERLAAIL